MFEIFLAIKCREFSLVFYCIIPINPKDNLALTPRLTLNRKIVSRGFLILSFFFTNLSFSQETKKNEHETSSQNATKHEEVKEVADIDLQQPEKVAIDSTIFNLKDIQIARVKDSLWLKEVFSSSLFDEMYSSIVHQDFDDVEYEELSTEVLKQRLKELNARTPFRVEYNPALENVIKHYLKNRRKSFERLMGLSEFYFPMFEEILDLHGLPLELKYLAIVESALNPSARSRVGATGLWQFMFTTGKMYGLDVSSYVDERSDPLRSTDAASRYLKSLNNSFNDWDLALAAYNSGPGNVSKAIRRSGGSTDYWKLRNYLPRETAGYVPAFLATMYIFEYANEHGFKKSSEERIPYVATDTVRVKEQITLEQVAKLTFLDQEEVEFLNPSYKLGIIPVVEGKDYVLRLPITAIGTFVTNEAAIYDYAQKLREESKESAPTYYEQPEKIRYRVQKGDFLGKIAQRYGVGVRQIQDWNGLRGTNLRVGQYLTIYPKKQVAVANANTTKHVASTSSDNSSEKIYVVRSGDTLWSISKKFPGVSVENIQKWNDISGTNLKPGTKLRIY